MSNKKVLITGSGGFIFSNFIRKAMYDKENYNFVSVDNLSDPKTLHNVYANRGHIFYMADITDSNIMDNIMNVERPDVVIHGAAESFVDASIVNPDKFINSNVLGTQVIVNKCIKYDVKKLIYISTDEVYGQLTNEVELPWTELSPTCPRNAYAATKLAGELLVKAASEVHGLKYNITRSCNNYGPRQSTRNFIPKILSNINNNIPIPIYGKGAQIREWIHVEDNCSAILKVLECGIDNSIYNISSSAEISNLELVYKICEISKKGHDLISFVSDRPGHDFRYSVDASKIKQLGWNPKYKFKQGLEHTCNWYDRNKWFLEKL